MKVTVCIIVALCVITVCTAQPRGGIANGRGPPMNNREHGSGSSHRHGESTGEPSHRHGEPPHRHGHNWRDQTL